MATTHAVPRRVGASVQPLLHAPARDARHRAARHAAPPPPGPRHLRAGPAADHAVADLRTALDLDAGYVSRLLAALEADGLIERRPSPADARRQEVRAHRDRHGGVRRARRALEGRDPRAARAAVRRGPAPRARRHARARGRVGAQAAHVHDPCAPGRRPRLGDPAARRACTHASTAGTRASRSSWRGSSPTTPSAARAPTSARGSPTSPAPPSAASSACARTPRPPSCGCCSSSRTRAGWASAPGSWSSACSSRSRRATPA